MTLIELLLLRIAEDEGRSGGVGRKAIVAPLASTTRRCFGSQSRRKHVALIREHMDDETAEGDGSRRGLTIDAAGDNVAAHIARHDPAGVLAECEAKRRIVQDHLDGSFDGSELLIAILASIYRHHPDYREECAIDA